MKLDTLVKDIRIIINSCTIKYTKLAKRNETVESMKASDEYIGAVDETDSFRTYASFSVEAIENAGMHFPEYDILAMAGNKNEIPEGKRDKVVVEQRKIVIRDYIELNNYYRMLLGLPDLTDMESDFIRLDEQIEIQYNIPHNTPVHELNADLLYALEIDGYLMKLIKENSTKKYLLYMGHNAINIVTAREANNFSILKVSHNVPDEFYAMFLKIYEQNREYYSSVLYIQDYSTKYDYYDNFIGLCIMVMTIQRIVSNTFKFGIQRNFFDWSFIQAMYKMYNIPFIEDLAMEYHMIILKNLNNLLRYKSTDKVLFDICSLLGYDRMNIFKYYLIKRHKLDEKEDPIFYYKEVTNLDGTTSLVEDSERMYELYFQAVNIKERNVTLALLDNNNRKDYNEVTLSDPYWWEDDDLTKVKYETEYNYVETKYLSLNLMYKMTEMLFEITYVFRMLIDKHDEIEHYLVALPKIYQDKEFKLFDAIIFLVCLVCKKNGFKTYTITTPSKTAHLYGFNFNSDDIEYVKTIIKENSNLIDPHVLTYLNNLSFKTPSDINMVFTQIREFNDFIINKMANSQNIREYQMYKKIFTIMTLSETQTSMFTIRDPEGNSRVAESYIEYLQFADPVLADIINKVETGDIGDMIDHILAKINEMMEDLKYLYIINDNNSPIFKSITELLRFFKSYTVDLTSFNILYIFDSKYFNMIKLIDDIAMVTGNLGIKDEFKIDYSDTIENTQVVVDKIKNYYKFNDEIKNYIKISFREDIIFTDLISSILQDMDTIDILNMQELINVLYKAIYLKSILQYDETLSIQINAKLNEFINYEDKINALSIIIDSIDNDINITDNNQFKSLVKTLHNLADTINYPDELKEIIINFFITSNIFDKDTFSIETHTKICDTINALYSDSATLHTVYSADKSHNIKLSDSQVLTTQNKFIDSRYYHDAITKRNSIYYHNDITYDKDNIMNVTKDETLIHSFNINDSIGIALSNLVSTKQKYKDGVVSIIKTLNYINELSIGDNNQLQTILSKFYQKDKITTTDKYMYKMIEYLLKIKFSEKDDINLITKSSHIIDSMNSSYSDDVTIHNIYNKTDSCKMKERLLLIYEN